MNNSPVFIAIACVEITGTFGLIVEAKLSGHIESVKPLLEKIKQTIFVYPKD